MMQIVKTMLKLYSMVKQDPQTRHGSWRVDFRQEYNFIHKYILEKCNLVGKFYQ